MSALFNIYHHSYFSLNKAIGAFVPKKIKKNRARKEFNYWITKETLKKVKLSFVSNSVEVSAVIIMVFKSKYCWLQNRFNPNATVFLWFFFLFSYFSKTISNRKQKNGTILLLLQLGAFITPCSVHWVLYV